MMKMIAVGFMQSMLYSAIAVVLFFVFILMLIATESDDAVQDVQEIEEKLKSRDSLKINTKND